MNGKRLPVWATAVLLIITVAFSAFVSPSFGASTWNSQVVDLTAYRAELSLALDATGNPHIAYIATETGSYYTPPLRFLLKFASWNGSTWDIQTIDADNASTIGLSSLTFDSENHAHIVYFSQVTYPNGGLMKYAHWTGSNWSIQTVDTGARAAIAIDSSDKPHIAYAGEDGLLKYASWNGINWTIQIVDPQSNRPPMAFNRGIGSDQYLAIDSSDKPFIVYAVNSTVKLAVGNQSGWTIQELISNETLQLGNIVLDSCGNPHFTYVLGLGNYSLFYTFWNGSNWSTQKVSRVNGSSDGSYIALDSENNPRITYIGSASPNYYAVRYVKWVGSEWEIQTAAEMGSTDYVAPLALDSMGNPHIGYLTLRNTGYSWVDATLHYVTSNHSIPVSTPSPEPSPSSSNSPSVVTSSPAPLLSPVLTETATPKPTVVASPSLTESSLPSPTVSPSFLSGTDVAVIVVVVLAVAAVVVVLVLKKRKLSDGL
ncbi:MAG: hypothetical protein NWF05_00695 [Candidatus Bathyarchaeota archaeon]|nr:hypothetical protein [Candidatus Bathyarchaeota archaeon]